MVLPTFLICGAHKAGTTALYRYLDAHPDVFMSRQKETGFFHEDEHYVRGIGWWKQYFEGHDGERAIGEASTLTMTAPKAPERIASCIPDARLIFLLRNPVDRIFSQYYFELHNGVIDPSVSFEQFMHGKTAVFGEETLRRGRYEKQLRRFDAHFPGEQMLVLLHEDLKEQTAETVRRTLDFIGVESDATLDVEQRHNVTRYPTHRKMYRAVRQLWQPFRQVADRVAPEAANALRGRARRLLFSEEKPEMRDEDRAYLREIYAEPNARLEERLGRDLSHWK